MATTRVFRNCSQPHEKVACFQARQHIWAWTAESACAGGGIAWTIWQMAPLGHAKRLLKTGTAISIICTNARFKSRLCRMTRHTGKQNCCCLILHGNVNCFINTALFLNLQVKLPQMLASGVAPSAKTGALQGVLDRRIRLVHWSVQIPAAECTLLLVI